MSDYRDERHDDASATSGSDAANTTQPTTPLPQSPSEQQTVPLDGAGASSTPTHPAPVSPYASAPSHSPQPGAPVDPRHGAYAAAQPAHPGQNSATPSYAAPHAPGAAFGAPGRGADAPQGAQPGYAYQASGGHHMPQQFGAAFGQPTGGATPAATAESAPRKRGAGALVGALALVALVGLGAGVGGAYLGSSLVSTSASSPQQGPATVTINNPDKVNTVAAVSAKALPSVVTLNVSGGQESGSGSGIVLSKDGYVLTNTHVVTLGGAEADATIRVSTSDGRIYDAKVVGTDPVYDLAVVKLSGATDLKPMEFGDSSSLNVGDQTIALGSPLGLDDTVTSGIVSALNRSIQIQSSAVPDNTATPDQQQQQDNSPFQFDLPGQQQQQQQSGEGSISISVIQTDAAINPGNSGGALVNAEGKLIGVNVAIASATSSSGESGNIGVGFAIPSAIAERVAQEIIKDGSASHGMLGASVDDAATQKGATTEGALLKTIVPNSAAAKAGLKVGDVVTKFGDTPIGNSIDLTAQVRALPAGSKTTITYNRDGESYTADVTLGELTAQ